MATGIMEGGSITRERERGGGKRNSKMRHSKRGISEGRLIWVSKKDDQKKYQNEKKHKMIVSLKMNNYFNAYLSTHVVVFHLPE